MNSPTLHAVGFVCWIIRRDRTCSLASDVLVRQSQASCLLLLSTSHWANANCLKAPAPHLTIQNKVNLRELRTPLNQFIHTAPPCSIETIPPHWDTLPRVMLSLQSLFWTRVSCQYNPLIGEKAKKTKKKTSALQNVALVVAAPCKFDLSCEYCNWANRRFVSFISTLIC